MEDRIAALGRLNEEVRACTRCDLHKTATQGVPGDGPVDAKIMLVGEAPGANEDRTGRPFVGAAGQFLNELLQTAGLNRDEVYITNVVKHRPPGNRDPNAAEIDACIPYLWRQIEIINPRLVVTLGRFALQTFFPSARMMRDHGQLREKEGRYFFPVLHPAAALHQESNRPLLYADMKKLGELLHDRFTGDSAPSEPESDAPPEQMSFF